jgi:hypothetical protein
VTDSKNSIFNVRKLQQSSCPLETLQLKTYSEPRTPKFPKIHTAAHVLVERSGVTTVEAAVWLCVAGGSRTAVTINPFIVCAGDETGSAALHRAVCGTIGRVLGGNGIDGASEGHEAEEEDVEFGHLVCF